LVKQVGTVKREWENGGNNHRIVVIIVVMKSFEADKVGAQPISQTMLQSVRALGEFKGHQALYVRQTPHVLDALRQAAIVQSTESSNRIEGVVASFGRIQAIVAHQSPPQNRSEQEIAGYRDVLNTIHTSYAHIPFTSNVVRQLHGDLYKYTSTTGGKWKSSDNEIVERAADGTRMVRFRPTPAWATPNAMEELHGHFNELWKSNEVEPLLLIPAYVLDFLCIHPFLDGNGRLSRLLTLLLLYQCGYEVGRYVGLERIVEESKESYYEALGRSSQNWHEGQHNLQPWTEYWMGTLLAAYRELEARVETLSSARGAKTEMVLEAFGKLPYKFRLTDLERACPHVTRDMIRVVLNRLKQEGRVQAIGRGAGAVWHKKEN
jgi:Fic family protein